MDPGFEAAISLERFARYLTRADSDRCRALELYALNTQLSEALYTPLQMLEVALRNRIHAVLSEARHERWFDEAGFLRVVHQIVQLSGAYEELGRANRERTPGRVVAALPFGFWTSMIARNYEVLWQATLNRIAQREDGKGLRRTDLSTPLSTIRVLRNRIARHEPILHWDLPKHNDNIARVTRWLSPAAAEWCERYSRFPEVWPAEGITLQRAEPKG